MELVIVVKATFVPANTTLEITGYLLDVKCFRNIATSQKPKRGLQQPPSPPLYHGGGIGLPVRPRVKGVHLSAFKGVHFDRKDCAALNSI